MEMVFQGSPVQHRYVNIFRVFLIEGIFTVLLAIASFFLIVSLPEHSTFLKPEEKTLLLKRLAEDDASNTDEQKTPLTIKEVFKTMTHWKVVLPCVSTPMFLPNLTCSHNPVFSPALHAISPPAH
jgi:hypothetical protein